VHIHSVTAPKLRGLYGQEIEEKLAVVLFIPKSLCVGEAKLKSEKQLQVFKIRPQI